MDTDIALFFNKPKPVTPKLLLICGRKDSGKSTFSNLIKRRINELGSCGIKTIVEFSLASHLKDIVAMALKLPRDLLEGDTLESRLYRKIAHPFDSDIHLNNKITPREILVKMGLWLRNTISLNIFVDIVAKKIQEEYKKNKNLYPVIPDCRFINEFDYFLKNYDEVNIFLIKREKAQGFYYKALEFFLKSKEYLKYPQDSSFDSIQTRLYAIHSFLIKIEDFYSDPAEEAEWFNTVLMITGYKSWFELKPTQKMRVIENNDDDFKQLDSALSNLFKENIL